MPMPLTTFRIRLANAESEHIILDR